ncbi:MAG: hypothetical protein J4432_00795 [DPANN group archaeon]|nr:hypothetical protein [DPANN group archaeon]
MALYRVYPEEPGQEIQIAEELKNIDKVKAIEFEDLAFGLRAIKVGAVFDDKNDNPEETEERIRNIPHVKNLESLGVSLIS